MPPELSRFIPPEILKDPVVVDESMAPIVGRISRYMSVDQVWVHFSSTPNETGGVRQFPYFRVDTGLIVCSDCLWMLKKYRNLTPEELQRHYSTASSFALDVVLWVEIGFEGLQALAEHPASRNWSEVGDQLDDEQRAIAIMTTGKDYYDSVMREFVAYRKMCQIAQDCFTDCNLAGILEKWE